MGKESWMQVGAFKTKDGREYVTDEHGTAHRQSILKMSKKERRRLYAQLRSAETSALATRNPIAEDVRAEEEGGSWINSPERQALLEEMNRGE